MLNGENIKGIKLALKITTPFFLVWCLVFIVLKFIPYDEKMSYLDFYTKTLAFLLALPFFICCFLVFNVLTLIFSSNVVSKKYPNTKNHIKIAFLVWFVLNLITLEIIGFLKYLK